MKVKVTKFLSYPEIFLGNRFPSSNTARGNWVDLHFSLFLALMRRVKKEGLRSQYEIANYFGGGAPLNPQARVAKASGISCDSGFTSVSTESITPIMVAATDKQSRDITLRSSTKYCYSESAYNLSGNCLSRKGDCEVSDQLMYNHGSDGT